MSKYIICQSFKKFHRAVFSIAHPKYSNFGGILDASLIKIIPQTQFSYRRGLTGMAYRSSSRDLINLHIETKY